MTRKMPPTRWHVSSYSTSGGGNCVEVGPLADPSGRIAVRDTKHRTGPSLLSTSDDWAALITTVKTGTLDH